MTLTQNPLMMPLNLSNFSFFIYRTSWLCWTVSMDFCAKHQPCKVGNITPYITYKNTVMKRFFPVTVSMILVRSKYLLIDEFKYIVILLEENHMSDRGALICPWRARCKNAITGRWDQMISQCSFYLYGSGKSSRNRTKNITGRNEITAFLETVLFVWKL